MTDIGIMIEGQEGLTWHRFARIALAVEDLGFESLFRSDHLTALEVGPQRPALELWSSLTWLALRTRRIRFGPLVCSMTFRHPSLLAMMAASLDVASAGRFDLGIGAGWHRGEHLRFGIPFPPYATRLEMLDEGAEVIKLLWSGRPAIYAGTHYRLAEAQSHPIPTSHPPPLIMGGKGERTLEVVARHATEWNCSYVGTDIFRRKSRLLDERCAVAGRDPRAVRRSAMLPFAVGRDRAAVQERIDAHRSTFPSLPPTPAEWRAQGFVCGAPWEIVEQIRELADAGVSRFMLQHNDLDDLASLETLARDVLPQLR